MKSAIYLGKENVQIQELPIPELGDHDVLVKNIYSSICGTDIAVYQHGPNTGHRITGGEEFGHETVSRVVAVGDKVTEFSVGERVYPYPLFATGDTKRAGTIGGFSEYIKIPDAKRNHSLYGVDDSISDKTVPAHRKYLQVRFRILRQGQLLGHNHLAKELCRRFFL